MHIADSKLLHCPTIFRSKSTKRQIGHVLKNNVFVWLSVVIICYLHVSNQPLKMLNCLLFGFNIENQIELPHNANQQVASLHYLLESMGEVWLWQKLATGIHCEVVAFVSLFTFVSSEIVCVCVCVNMRVCERVREKKEEIGDIVWANSGRERV